MTAKLCTDAQDGGTHKRDTIHVGHQEVMGSVQLTPWSHPVLVIAEEWPSMAFAAHALGCLGITTWCSFLSAKSKVEFESTRLGSTLMRRPLPEVARPFAGQPGLTVLIQGGSSFVNEHRRWVENELKQAKTLEIIPEGEGEGWDETFMWKGKLSHQALGGVTSSSWLFCCYEPLAEPRKGLALNTKD